MRRFPQIGDHVRDRRTGEMVEILAWEGFTNSSLGICARVKPVTAEASRSVHESLDDLVPLADVERLS